MENKYVSASEVKTLEDYAFALVLGNLTLQTLFSFHKRAIEIGILKEDQECRAQTILWDLKRVTTLYLQQAASVLELLPEDYNFENIMDKIKDVEIKKAKEITKKKREKKTCDT